MNGELPFFTIIIKNDEHRTIHPGEILHIDSDSKPIKGKYKVIHAEEHTSGIGVMKQTGTKVWLEKIN